MNSQPESASTAHIHSCALKTVDLAAFVRDVHINYREIESGIAGRNSDEEALSLCEELQPDIVISDVVMKGISGIVLGIKLKESGCKARILLMSGQATTNDLLEEAKT